MNTQAVGCVGWRGVDGNRVRLPKRKCQGILFWTKWWQYINEMEIQVSWAWSGGKKGCTRMRAWVEKEMEKKQAMSMNSPGTRRCGGCHTKSNSKCITKQLGIFKVISTDYRHIFCYIFYIIHKSINAAYNKTRQKNHCYILCLQK